MLVFWEGSPSRHFLNKSAKLQIHSGSFLTLAFILHFQIRRYSAYYVLLQILILTRCLPNIVAIFGSPIVKRMTNHSRSCTTKPIEMRDMSITKNVLTCFNNTFTPWKINVEPENQLFGKEIRNNILQTCIVKGSM